VERTVLWLAKAIGRALGIRHGEITIQFSGEEVTILRQAITLKPAQLEEIVITL
jgi:hypothetical protein